MERNEGLEKRAAALQAKDPDLSVNLTLYPTAEGGRQTAIQPGWGCPCSIDKAASVKAWDGYPLLGGKEMQPGEMRMVGISFLSSHEAVAALTAVRKFYLWEGRAIGEAVICASPTSV